MITVDQYEQIEKLLTKNGLKYSQRSKIMKELKEILKSSQDKCALVSKRVMEVKNAVIKELNNENN